MAQSSIKETYILLLGKTGYGKSSTGNSILGYKKFIESDSSDSVTSKIQPGVAERYNRKIKVVDGPGLQETRMNKGEFLKKMVNDTANAVWEISHGFHALVLVLKYGNRFTNEDLQVLTILRKIFGENFVKEFCIVVFTLGDLFEINNKNRTFKDWCKEQKGALKELMDECEERIVLFDNRCEDQNKMSTQVDQLLVMIDKLSASGKRYTNELFEKVAEQRERFIVEINAPELKEEFQSKIDFLFQKLSKVEMNPNVTTDDLDDLIEEGATLMAYIKKEDKDTGVLDEHHKEVKSIIESVQDYRKAAEEKEKEEIRKRYNLAYQALTVAQNRRRLDLFQRGYASLFDMWNEHFSSAFSDYYSNNI